MQVSGAYLKLNFLSGAALSTQRCWRGARWACERNSLAASRLARWPHRLQGVFRSSSSSEPIRAALFGCADLPRACNPYSFWALVWTYRRYNPSYSHSHSRSYSHSHTHIRRCMHTSEGLSGSVRNLVPRMSAVAEYAKSSWGACRGCGAKIDKGELRLGSISKAPGGFDITRWYHATCYAESGADCSPEALLQVGGLSVLKAADQAKIRELAGVASLKRKAEHAPDGGAEGEVEDVSKRKLVLGGGARLESAKVASSGQSSWQTVLERFTPGQLSNSYKGARLPEGWKSYHTVIISQVRREQLARNGRGWPCFAGGGPVSLRRQRRRCELSRHSARLLMTGGRLWQGAGVAASKKVAAFDFDGCLVNTSVRRPGAHAWRLMYACVPAKLREFHSQGFKLVIFTNESNIDRFINTRQKAVDSKIGRLVFIACGKSGTGDTCRKPGAGMWQLLKSHFNDGVPIDMETWQCRVTKGLTLGSKRFALCSSFYVGDAAGREKDHSDADIGFARAVGLRFLVPEEVFEVSP
eukprot:jgi/Mesen1/374/ME000010S_10833